MPDGEDRFRARLAVALAAITGTYDGTVAIVGQGAAQQLQAGGRGPGQARIVKGTATISLRAEGDGTVVDVAGTVQAAGPVARVGQRLIGSVGKMMQDRFFGCLQGKL